MIAGIIIICIAIIIALLLSVKITLKIKYNEKLTVYLKILFVTIRLYPSKKKKKRYPHSMSKKKAQKIKKSLEKKPKKKKKKKDEKEKYKKDDLISIISIIINFVKNFIRLFAKAIRLKASRLKVTVASEDAADTALTYTAITQSINILFPLLDSLKTVKKLPCGKELSVNADFTADEPSADIEIELYVRIGGALKALCGAAIRAFKKAVKDQIKRLEKKR